MLGLTKYEVMGNVILFLFAGFQTTADTMFLIFYELASHPEVQEKVKSILLFFIFIDIHDVVLKII